MTVVNKERKTFHLPQAVHYVVTRGKGHDAWNGGHPSETRQQEKGDRKEEAFGKINGNQKIRGAGKQESSAVAKA